jgi:hypothetical protein
MCAAVSADAPASCVSVEPAVLVFCLTKYIQIGIMVTVSEKRSYYE